MVTLYKNIIIGITRFKNANMFKHHQNAIYKYFLYLYITRRTQYSFIVLIMIVGLKFSLFVPLVYADEVPLVDDLLKAKQIACKELLASPLPSLDVNSDAFTKFVNCWKQNLTFSKSVIYENNNTSKITIYEIEWNADSGLTHRNILQDITLNKDSKSNPIYKPILNDNYEPVKEQINDSTKNNTSLNSINNNTTYVNPLALALNDLTDEYLKKNNHSLKGYCVIGLVYLLAGAINYFFSK